MIETIPSITPIGTMNPADDLVATALKRGESQAVVSMHSNYRSLRQQTKALAELARFESGIAMAMPRLDMIILNRVMMLGVEEEATESTIDEIVEFYRSNAVRRFAVQLSQYATPNTIPEWLLKRGFVQTNNWSIVYRAPGHDYTPQSDLRVTRIGWESSGIFATIAGAVFGVPEAFHEYFTASIGCPGWQYYLAWDNDIPVGCGVLYIEDGIGWMGIGGVMPAYRRRGGQSALIARRLQDAEELGCRIICTETAQDTPTAPSPSYHNMIRAGFKLAYHRPNFILST